MTQIQNLCSQYCRNSSALTAAEVRKACFHPSFTINRDTACGGEAGGGVRPHVFFIYSSMTFTSG